eukprot:3147058-Alexandrium_andersonii.AAC.1
MCIRDSHSLSRARLGRLLVALPIRWSCLGEEWQAPEHRRIAQSTRQPFGRLPRHLNVLVIAL